MNWTKFGDEYPAEARELTDAEWRTHGEALMWSSWRLLDLHIPKKDVRRFAEYDSDISLDVVTAGLVAKGWWRDDGDEWYVGLIHPEWQRDADEVRTDRAKAAARMKRIAGTEAVTTVSARPTPAMTHLFARTFPRTHGRTDRRTCAERSGTPTRPDPTRPVVTYDPNGASTRL